MKSKALDGILKSAAIVFDEKEHTYTSTLNGEFYTSCTTIAEAWRKEFVGPWYSKEAVMDLGWFDQYKDGKRRPIEEIKKDKIEFAKRFELLKAMDAGNYYDLLQDAKGAAKRKGDLAKTNGTSAHDHIQNRIEFRMDPMIELKESPKVKEVVNAVTSFAVWEAKQDIQWLLTEEIVASEKWKIAGRVDSLCNYNKLLTLSDIKTSGQVGAGYLLQLAGYDLMLAEMGLQVRQWLIMRTPKDGTPMETLTINNLDDMKFFKETFLHQREAHKFYSYMKSKYENKDGKIKVDQDIEETN